MSIVVCDWCGRSGVGSRFPLTPATITLGGRPRRRALVCDRCAVDLPTDDGPAQ